MVGSQHWKSYFKDDLLEQLLWTAYAHMGTWNFLQYDSLSSDPVLLGQEEITEARIAWGSERLQRKPRKVKHDIVL